MIHFSSLFGTGKLPIRRPEHYTFLHTLQRSIIYRHPVVLNVADQIINALGGTGNFIGLHVRYIKINIFFSIFLGNPSHHLKAPLPFLPKTKHNPT